MSNLGDLRRPSTKTTGQSFQRTNIFGELDEEAERVYREELKAAGEAIKSRSVGSTLSQSPPEQNTHTSPPSMQSGQDSHLPVPGAFGQPQTKLSTRTTGKSFQRTNIFGELDEAADREYREELRRIDEQRKLAAVGSSLSPAAGERSESVKGTASEGGKNPRAGAGADAAVALPGAFGQPQTKLSTRTTGKSFQRTNIFGELDAEAEAHYRQELLAVDAERNRSRGQLPRCSQSPSSPSAHPPAAQSISPMEMDSPQPAGVSRNAANERLSTRTSGKSFQRTNIFGELDPESERLYREELKALDEERKRSKYPTTSLSPAEQQPQGPVARGQVHKKTSLW